MSIFDKEFKKRTRPKKKKKGSTLPRIYKGTGNGFLCGKKLTEALEGKKLDN